MSLDHREKTFSFACCYYIVIMCANDFTRGTILSLIKLANLAYYLQCRLVTAITKVLLPKERWSTTDKFSRVYTDFCAWAIYSDGTL